MYGKQLAVWSCGRIQSTRCPNKMLRPFHDSTLTDIFLSKLAELESDVFFAGYEPVFQEKCQKHGVPFVQRTQESAEIDGPASLVYSFLDSQPYEYMLCVNACLPFLKTSTIVTFLERCAEEDMKPCMGVIKRNNFFVDLDGQPLNFPGDLRLMNTKTVTPVHEFANALYFFRKADFLKLGFWWDFQEVRYVELASGIEMFDIDTEDDFSAAEAMWNGLGAGAMGSAD